MTEKEKFAFIQILSELFFVLLPIIVIIILLSISGKFKTILEFTDFSFVSIVLFGQTIVKFTSGAAKNKIKKKWQIISIATSSILVFGIIPSTTVLIKIFENTNLPNWVFILQFVLFLISIITYILLGTVGQIYLDEEENLRTTKG